MKVCPACQARFEGGEVFCPNDGTKLVDARELSPGKLTGLELDEVVKLERLEACDKLGERYGAKLATSGKAVRVTVFNQGFQPPADRQPMVDDAAARLTDPVPSALLALHSTDLERDDAYVIEESPRGPSLRSVLEERRTLDWQSATRVVCNLGRALGFLADRGIVHRAVHPEAIFVTDLNSGQIQLGEWAQGLVSWRDEPLEAAKAHPGQFLGYTAYMAPEVIRDGTAIDERSLIYTMGMILYELIVGKAPFTSKVPADTLKRHLHEKPLKLAIAKGGGDLHPELDDALDMMWIKAPERRFQKPLAAIGALSTLLDASPDKVAPPLQPRAKYVFVDADFAEPAERADAAASTDDAVQADDAASTTAEGAPHKATQMMAGLPEGDDEGHTDKKTVAGMPAVAMGDGDDDEDAAADDEARVRTVSGEVDVASDTIPDDSARADEAGPSIIIDDPEMAAAAGGEGDADTEAETPAAKKTMMMGSAAEMGLSDDADEADPETETKAEADAAFDVPKSGIIKLPEKKKAGAKDADAKDAEASEDEEPASKKTMVMGSAADLGTADEPAEAEADAKAEAAGEAEAKPANGMEIGFVEPEGAQDAGFGDEDWFGGGSSEAVWETSYVEEHEERSERRLKIATIGVGVVLVLLAVGIYIFSETYEEPSDEAAVAAEDQAEAVAPVDEEDAVDVEALRAQFDEAMEAGRLVPPAQNSAARTLEELKREAADTPTYEEAREQFVTRAYQESKALDLDENLRLARDLVGYANQFAPDNAAIAARLEELDQKLRAGGTDAGADAGGAHPDAAAPQADTPEPGAEPAAATASAGSKPAAAGSRPATTRPQPKPTPAPKRAAPSGPSPSQLLSEARSAKSGGRVDDAVRLYQQVLDAQPSNHRAHAGLGEIYFDRAAYAQAVKHQNKAVQLNPSNTDYRLKLGSSYYRLGRYKEALSTWEAVLARDPNNAVAKRYVNLAKKKLN